MPGKSFTSEQILAILTDTPSCIAELTAGLFPAQLRIAPNPGEWSANEASARQADLQHLNLGTSLVPPEGHYTESWNCFPPRGVIEIRRLSFIFGSHNRPKEHE